MKNCTTQLLCSLSLVYMVYSASTSSSEETRTKRSLLLDNVLLHRHRWQKQDKGIDKRDAFATLNPKEILKGSVKNEMSNVIPGAQGPCLEDKNIFDYLVKHEVAKRSSFDTLDLDAMLNDPEFLNTDVDDNRRRFDYDETYFMDSPMYNDLPPLEKEEMSNVIPGAHRPCLMDRFVEFLALDEMGMLDRCLENGKRK